MNRIALGIAAFALIFPPVFHARAAELATESVVYAFCGLMRCADGAQPASNVIDIKGILYGTTSRGGHNHYENGTVFALDPATGAERVLHAFGHGDGHAPYGALIRLNGTLYGTTVLGGSDGCDLGCGTVFSVRLGTGKERVLYAFAGGSDGSGPAAGLTVVDGTLYGTTAWGGVTRCRLGCGTVFSIDPATGTETVLHRFREDTTDGYDPEASLLYRNGSLYGTTADGGGRYGTVFAVNPTTGEEAILHAFAGSSDGAVPLAALTEMNGMLYGTTSAGGGTGCGGHGCGTVFSLDPATGTETVLHSFGGERDGADPEAGLINVNGTLYGTTYLGGSRCGAAGSGCGTVFSIDPGTGTETILYTFVHGKDGKLPASGLLNVNGKLYGTTIAGGTRNGTVFAIAP